MVTLPLLPGAVWRVTLRRCRRACRKERPRCKRIASRLPGAAGTAQATRRAYARRGSGENNRVREVESSMLPPRQRRRLPLRVAVRADARLRQ